MGDNSQVQLFNQSSTTLVTARLVVYDKGTYISKILQSMKNVLFLRLVLQTRLIVEGPMDHE